MGYVPPTLEEWNDPALLEARIRRQQTITATLIIIGVAALVVMIGVMIIAGF